MSNIAHFNLPEPARQHKAAVVHSGEDVFHGGLLGLVGAGLVGGAIVGVLASDAFDVTEGAADAGVGYTGGE